MPVSSEKSSRKAVGFRLLLNAFWEIRSQRRRWRSALFRDPGRALVARSPLIAACDDRKKCDMIIFCKM